MKQSPSKSPPAHPRPARFGGFAGDIIERVGDAVVALDRDWRYTYANPKAGEILQRSPESLLGKNIWKEFPEGVSHPFHGAYRRALAKQEFVTLEDNFPAPDRWFENRIYPSPDGLLVFFHDITDRKTAEAMIAGQSRIMEMIASGEPLKAVLDALLRLIESQFPDMLCSVLLLDSDGVHVRHGASPSLPESFTRAIDGQPIGERAGSCGTAAYRREPVVVEDIETDPLWTDYRAIAREYGLRACWSTPVFDAARRVLATFAIYYRQPCGPTRRHWDLVAMATHITAVAIGHHQKEAAIVAGKERYRSTLDNILEGCQLIGFDWKYLYLNPAAARHNRRPNQELLGRTMMEAWPGIEATSAFALLRRCLEGRTPQHEEIEFVFPDGGRGWFDVRCQPVPEGIFVLSIDTTQRRGVESALRESEGRFRQIAENIEEVFWVRDVEKRQILYVSPGYEAIWGRTCASLYASAESWTGSIHPEDLGRVRRAVEEKQMLGGYDETYRIVRPDGAIRWVRDRSSPVRDRDGRVFRVVGTAQDVTASKESELRLQLQHAVTSVLAEAGSAAEMNPKILEILCHGLQSECGELWMVDRAAQALRCAEIWHSSSAGFAEFAAASRRISFKAGEGLPGHAWASGRCAWSPEVMSDERFPRRALVPAGLDLRGWIGFPIRVRSEILGVVEFFFLRGVPPPDAALRTLLDSLGAQLGQFIERRLLAEQVRQAQKMEAIGTLAGGIAHDFNNVLAAIKGYTELARTEAAGNASAVECLDAVLTGADRAIDLVRQILTFSRRQETERKPIRLQPAAGEALKLLRATLPSTIEIASSFAADAPAVLADATQIHQIVMNLCTNAAHAMKGRSGRLTVRLEKVGVDAALASAVPGLKPGDYACLTVADTGGGMDEATLSRIFEPFFTTKEPGEGTGLGLSVVHGIVRSHDGAIAVHSRPGEGTAFQLYFPALAGEAAAAEVPAAKAPRGRGERILYIDDDAALAALGKRTLEQLDYVVDAVTDPAEALARVRAEPGSYDLVVTDHAMPKLTGAALVAQIRGIRPNLPIVLISGLSSILTADGAREMGIQALLPKPISVDALGKIVHKVLLESEKG